MFEIMLYSLSSPLATPHNNFSFVADAKKLTIPLLCNT